MVVPKDKRKNGEKYTEENEGGGLLLVDNINRLAIILGVPIVGNNAATSHGQKSTPTK